MPHPLHPLLALLPALACACTPCEPQCDARTCGPDPVCGLPCGTCFDDEECSAGGTCTPRCSELHCDDTGCELELELREVELSGSVAWRGGPLANGIFAIELHDPHALGPDDFAAFVGSNEGWEPAVVIPLDNGATDYRALVPAGHWNVYLRFEEWYATFTGLAPLAQHLDLRADATLDVDVRGARLNVEPSTYVLREPGTGRLLYSQRAFEGTLAAWQGTFDVYAYVAGGSTTLLAPSFVVDRANGVSLPPLPRPGTLRVEATWNGEPFPIDDVFTEGSHSLDLVEATAVARSVTAPSGMHDIHLVSDGPNRTALIVRDVVIAAERETTLQVDVQAAPVVVDLFSDEDFGEWTHLEVRGDQGSYSLAAAMVAPGHLRAAGELPVDIYQIGDGAIVPEELVVVGPTEVAFVDRHVEVPVAVSFDGVPHDEVELRLCDPGEQDIFYGGIGVRSPSAEVHAQRYDVRLSTPWAVPLALGLAVDEQATLSFDLDTVVLRGDRPGRVRGLIFNADDGVALDATNAFALTVPAGVYGIDAIVDEPEPRGGPWRVPVARCVLLDDSD